jgi:predicted nucleic acid-binding protein
VKTAIYIDSSSLLKTLWFEPESLAVAEAINREEVIIVSTLALLETDVQLRGKWLGGGYRQAQYRSYRSRLMAYRAMDPFHVQEIPGAVFSTAIHPDFSNVRLHVRTLDMLHLAAMRELHATRLMTNDRKQAAAAHALGYEVVVPEGGIE